MSAEKDKVSIDNYEKTLSSYGQAVKAADILSGKVKPPRGVQKLLEVLAKY